MLLIILTIISSFSFLYYGIIFFLNAGMKNEFERYGLRRFRNLTGGLQLLGGIGLLVGFVWQPISLISSGGLTLLMLSGLIVRIKMKDGFLLSLPSFGFMIINGVIFLVSLLENKR
ncbi:DoxX family protein [Pedobacter sp. UYP1]|jgi:uncharacterized membrane protein YphA (DoxX/SURF4 family)|uniref:DoxX family protein n=1 Tax=Pedobacter sp. UYP1 TaxID=1756396 RepID=UPI00339B0285